MQSRTCQLSTQRLPALPMLFWKVAVLTLCCPVPIGVACSCWCAVLLAANRGQAATQAVCLARCMATFWHSSSITSCTLPQSRGQVGQIVIKTSQYALTQYATAVFSGVNIWCSPAVEYRAAVVGFSLVGWVCWICCAPRLPCMAVNPRTAG